MFDWKKYLDVAEKFAKNSDECSQRIAISRAYYAAFNYTKHRRIYGNVYGNKFSGPNSHEDMWREAFKDDSEFQFFDDAITLKDFRKHADYDSSSHNISKECKISIKLAKNIIKYVSDTSNN